MREGRDEGERERGQREKEREQREREKEEEREREREREAIATIAAIQRFPATSRFCLLQPRGASAFWSLSLWTASFNALFEPPPFEPPL